MRVTTAQLPEPPAGDDRIFVTDNAVIMLDGASAFARQEVPAATYAGHLGGNMVRSLQSEPEADLAAVLADAIADTAAALSVSPGDGAPSSTVAICRYRHSDMSVDLLVLGDSQIAIPGRILRDDRLASIGAEQRAAYYSRLRAGHGYDEQHRRLVKALQEEQLKHRNQPGGYWIAEADPEAAHQALTHRAPLLDLPWCVLATDGAYKPMELHEMDDWERIATLDGSGLRDLLARCHRQEANDPDGRTMKRAKRHDDKAVAAVRL